MVSLLHIISVLKSEFILSIAFHVIFLLFYYKWIWNLHSIVLLDDQVTLHQIWDPLHPFLELWMSHKPLPCPSWVRQGYSAARKVNRWQIDNCTVAWKLTFSWTKRGKNLTKTTATTTKLHSIPESQKDHRVPLNPRNQVQVDADTQRCEEGMWKSMLSTVRAPCAIHPWILLHPPLTLLFLCKSSKPGPLCAKCLIPVFSSG